APAPRQTAELGVDGPDADVTPRRELAAAGEAVAVDRRHGRLAGIEPCEPHRAGSVDVVVLEEGHGVLQIRAGAERQVTRSRHDENARPRIGCERLDRAADAD